MLTQLRQAGKLDDVAGVIFGEMAGCVSGPDDAVTVRDVIRDAFAGARYPVVLGLLDRPRRAATRRCRSAIRARSPARARLIAARVARLAE